MRIRAVCDRTVFKRGSTIERGWLLPDSLRDRVWDVRVQVRAARGSDSVLDDLTSHATYDAGTGRVALTIPSDEPLAWDSGVLGVTVHDSSSPEVAHEIAAQPVTVIPGVAHA